MTSYDFRRRTSDEDKVRVYAVLAREAEMLIALNYGVDTTLTLTKEEPPKAS